MATLDNRQYFPSFDELPLMDEFVDPVYYADVGGGTMLPTKHWAFVADIVDDSLSHMADFFHRVEVRDLTGTSASVLFTPDQRMNYGQLRRGCTLFVRYAAKAYFSDLITQVIKVEDCAYVKVIPRPLDDLMMLSAWYFGGSTCAACRAPLGGAGVACGRCEAAHYCGGACMAAHAREHAAHCGLCASLMQVLNVDMDRFMQPVPFR
ncbi:hypothetical protein HT031_000449 [Scenedesmus sp. PABB004]|nr:hypothetical protein HT031_000449 [Scenedesmus sp. PABB004]